MTFVMWKNIPHSKQISKLLAVIICLCLACYQLSGCFRKLLHPPVLTHYNFDLNETLNFPAITVCRTSPYKLDVYEKYGMGPGGPEKTASWRTFNFHNYTVQEFFDEATYTLEEVLPFYGFDSLAENADIISFYRLHYGRCFTITPKNETTKWDSNGYFLHLTHTDKVKQVENGNVLTTGFHIYIHDRREVFTGSLQNVGSFINYLFAEIHVDIKLNLKVNVYEQVSTSDSVCNPSFDYSISKCQLTCIQKLITEQIGCSAPWMPNSDLHYCSDYDRTRSLLSAYDKFKWDAYVQRCACTQPCHIRTYNHYINGVRGVSMSVSNLAVTFPTNAVVVMTEVLGYDWNMFVADLGGSLGFLLGISVLGIVKTCEEMINALICKDRSDGNANRHGDNVDEQKKDQQGNGGIEVGNRREQGEMKAYYEQ